MTKEQIIAEAWIALEHIRGPATNFYKEKEGVVKRDGEYFYNNEFVESDAHWCWFDEETKRLWIEDFKGENKYHGECPDIETFRYLCNLLNIK